jgi:hypothetical protein
VCQRAWEGMVPSYSVMLLRCAKLLGLEMWVVVVLLLGTRGRDRVAFHLYPVRNFLP